MMKQLEIAWPTTRPDSSTGKSKGTQDNLEEALDGNSQSGTGSSSLFNNELDHMLSSAPSVLQPGLIREARTGHVQNIYVYVMWNLFLAINSHLRKDLTPNCRISLMNWTPMIPS